MDAKRKKVLDQLKVYRALDNPLRLTAYLAIKEEPRLPFREIARKLGRSSGLTAYHVGVLKSAGLVDMNYVRHSKETSEYVLSKRGEEVYRSLFGRKRSRQKYKGRARGR